MPERFVMPYEVLMLVPRIASAVAIRTTFSLPVSIVL